jgi:predicted nucleic acid-binding protein
MPSRGRPSGSGSEAIDSFRKRRKLHDTWIAATALAHGAEVWTQDADFGRFAAVDVGHPAGGV